MARFLGPAAPCTVEGVSMTEEKNEVKKGKEKIIKERKEKKRNGKRNNRDALA